MRYSTTHIVRRSRTRQAEQEGTRASARPQERQSSISHSQPHRAMLAETKQQQNAKRLAQTARKRHAGRHDRESPHIAAVGHRVSTTAPTTRTTHRSRVHSKTRTAHKRIWIKHAMCRFGSPKKGRRMLGAAATRASGAVACSCIIRSRLNQH